MDISWDEYLMGFAYVATRKSKDPSTQVGACIASPNHVVVSTGFNGFARGILDTETRLNTRELKYKLIIHAEHNAILHAKIDLTNHTIYSTRPPCIACTNIIIQTGIKRVVSWYNDPDYDERWYKETRFSKELLHEARVDYSYRTYTYEPKSFIWQSIETALKDGTKIDLFGTRNGKPKRFPDAHWGEKCFGGQSLNTFCWHHPSKDIYGDFEYTHWMHRPELPEIEIKV